MDESKKDIIFSKNPLDYEVLIRSNLKSYSAVCPQINKLIKGDNLDKIKAEMKIQILKFIEHLPKTQEEIELEEEIKNQNLEERKRIQEDFINKLQGKKVTGISKEEIFKKLENIGNSEKQIKSQIRTKTPIFEQKFEDLDNYFYNSDVAI